MEFSKVSQNKVLGTKGEVATVSYVFSVKYFILKFNSDFELVVRIN